MFSFLEPQLPLLLEDAGRPEHLLIAQEKEEQELTNKIAQLEKDPKANQQEIEKLKKQKETAKVFLRMSSLKKKN